MKRLVFIIPFFLLACTSDDFLTRAYKVLTASKVVYNTTMTVASNMYDNGEINDTQKDIIIKYGDKFYKAYTEAATALIEYAYMKEKSKNADTEMDVVFIKIKYAAYTLEELVRKINIVDESGKVAKVYVAAKIAFSLLEEIYGQTNRDNDFGNRTTFGNKSVNLTPKGNR